MAGARIEARDLGRRLRDGTWLWRHLNCSVAAGQVIGILGRNGSGKTTLLQTLLQLRRAEEGTVHTTVTIGYVPQVTQLTLPFTVRDVVTMGRARHVRFFGGLTPVDMQSIDLALDSVGLTALAERSFLELSGGECQLVLIARALASECQALLLDEPFASLDLDNQRRTLALLASLAQHKQLSILFSAHHPDHVFTIADTVLVLRRGEAPICGPVNRVLTAELLSQTYGVPVEVVEIPHLERPGRHAVPLL